MTTEYKNNIFSKMDKMPNLSYFKMCVLLYFLLEFVKILDTNLRSQNRSVRKYSRSIFRKLIEE